MGVVARWSLVAQLGELVEEFGDLEMDEAVVGLDARPCRLPGVVGEHDPGGAVDDRVEEPVAGVGPEPNPARSTPSGFFCAQRIAIGHSAAAAAAPCGSVSPRVR